MSFIVDTKEALLHWLFPHYCVGCGSSLLDKNSCLCIECISKMPATNYANIKDNAVEKIFWGRLPIESAGASFYFSKKSMMQELLHECKYGGNKELLFQLGKMMGEHIKNQERFEIDALVPLPLHRHKEKRRGYNQALILCKGMAEVLNLPIKNDLVIRNRSTETQTKKDRIHRWSGMDGKFSLKGNVSMGSHLLLVDDVITTGATLESCGQTLLQLDGVRLSIFALCYSSN